MRHKLVVLTEGWRFVPMKALVAYFSRAGENYSNGDVVKIEEGNTEVVAKKIAILTNGELFKIEQATPYSDDYYTCIEESKEHKAKNMRPELVNCITSIDDYDIIYLGYPNYWNSLPRCILSFIEKFDFTGKIIKPFCTHGGSGFGNSVEELKAECKGAFITKGLEITGTEAHGHDDDIVKWLEKTSKYHDVFSQ